VVEAPGDRPVPTAHNSQGGVQAADDVIRVVVKEMRAAYANPDALAAQGGARALAKRIERRTPAWWV
jgi:hypothetical protein